MTETDLRSPPTLSRHAVLPQGAHPWLDRLRDSLVECGFTVGDAPADGEAFEAFVSGASVVIWALSADADAEQIAKVWLNACERCPTIMPVTVLWVPAPQPALIERCIAAGFDEVFDSETDPAMAAAKLTGRTAARTVHHSLAARDPLTGLVTQQVFFSRLDPTVRLSSRAGMPMAVAVLDMDRMRMLETTRGREVVRSVLKDVAAHLRRVLRRSDTIARLGDDRFGLILHQITAFEARKLLFQLWKGLALQPETVAACGPTTERITFTAGVAVFPGDSSDGTELYTRAELALDVARATGQRRVLLYSETAGDAGAQSGSTDLRYHRVDTANRSEPE
ncbi:MAG: diguanylate cyclase [Myxococcales bacterium]|nr:diguanylate cyclase [Myxococcales bacterium]